MTLSPKRYSAGAIALHWAIALLLVFQMGLGWRMVNMGNAPQTFAAFQFHKSLGIAILMLSLARLVLRGFASRPVPVEANPAAAYLAKAVHGSLYAFMIVGPLTGWALVSTAKITIPTKLFGMIPWPHLPLSQTWHELSEAGHSILAWVGAALIVLHLAGAVRHHLARSNDVDVIGRMVPLFDAVPRRGQALSAAFGAIALLAASFAAPWLLYHAGPAPEAPLPAALASASTELDAPIADEPTVAASGSETAEEPVKASAWTVQPGGKLGFTASMSGSPIAGRFDKWSAQIVFDPDALEDSSIVVKVLMLSADTSNSERDTMLRGPEFFGNAGTAVFRSQKIRLVSGERYVASGTLGMNGVSRPLSLAYSVHIDGDRATASGTATIDRTSFGIGSGQWAATDQIAAKVAVQFSLNARKAN